MALPDYDIISDVNLNHATALAELLCNEGFRDINVINAIHITTVRVRIKNVTLLDATFVPKVLMDSIPYLDIGQFRLVHPNYQKIDQRLSLATLMADTGASLNIFNRLLKDNTRNNILRDWFDIEINKETKIIMKRIKLPLSMLQKMIKTSNISMLINHQLHVSSTREICASLAFSLMLCSIMNILNFMKRWKIRLILT